MKHAFKLKSQGGITNNKNFHATREDFEQLFAKQKTELLRLSLHLTADAEKSVHCLMLAVRDCLFGSTVSKDRVNTWARRMVIRNAIQLVYGTRNDIVGESGFECTFQPSEFPLQDLRESIAILTLPDLERLAFVIGVLERYSILDCALLLGKSTQEVCNAIVRARSLVVPDETGRDGEPTPELAAKICGDIRSQRNDPNASCGSIFESPLDGTIRIDGGLHE